MSDISVPQVAIVDYGMGNLFSVKHACEQVGLQAIITRQQREILTASAVILPGVGAFGVAMETLTNLGLVECLQEVGASKKFLLGICLGMQLLMTESHEFGLHQGLGLIEGQVVRLQEEDSRQRRVRVPQVGWNRVHEPRRDPYSTSNPSIVSSWNGTLLDGFMDGEYMYFVHSFYCMPINARVILAKTSYGESEFCSAVHYSNIFGCQFHPERSGIQGMRLYRNLALLLSKLIVEVKGVQ